jgi:predicted dehydrogenase
VARVQPVRIGLVGYGKGGRFFHAPLIAAAADCELAGVVTRSAERRGELARDHPGTPAYDDLAQLASAGVDAVAISTPADTHVPLVQEAVSLGLPVVCDKPFALQSAAARQALENAERTGVPLTVYQNRRYDADFLTVRAVLGSGELGQVIRLESRMEQYTPAGGIPASGGGILLDLGAHLVDQALRLTCIGWALQAVRVELLECGRPGCGRAPLCSLSSIAAGSCERAGGSRGA